MNNQKDSANFNKYKYQLNKLEQNFLTFVYDSDLKKVNNDTQFLKLIDDNTFFNFCQNCDTQVWPSDYLKRKGKCCKCRK